MALSPAEVDQLRAAAARLRSLLANGVSGAEVNGEKLTFRSQSDLRSELQMIEAQLAGIDVGAIRQSYPRTTRGL